MSVRLRPSAPRGGSSVVERFLAKEEVAGSNPVRRSTKMLLINFKTYPQTIGPNALEMTRKLFETAQGFPQIKVGFAPPALELAEVAKHSGAPIWAQHIDPAQEGPSTGYLSPADAQAAGAVGTFLNHSEHPLDQETIQKTLSLAKDHGLKVLIFARDPQRVAEFQELSPDFIAYEPPELIGGAVSVTSAKPEVIGAAVTAAGDIPLLIGAGIHEKADIEKALSLGAIGAVVSSAVVISKDPQRVYTDLLEGFKR